MDFLSAFMGGPAGGGGGAGKTQSSAAASSPLNSSYSAGVDLAALAPWLIGGAVLALGLIVILLLPKK